MHTTATRPSAPNSALPTKANDSIQNGATGTLGLAFAATGSMFPFFSAMLGWLGMVVGLEKLFIVDRSGRSPRLESS